MFAEPRFDSLLVSTSHEKWARGAPGGGEGKLDLYLTVPCAGKGFWVFFLQPKIRTARGCYRRNIPHRHKEHKEHKGEQGGRGAVRRMVARIVR